MNIAKAQVSDSMKMMQLMLLCTLIVMIPTMLMAQTPTNTGVGVMICFIANNFLGNTGRGIATIGISVLGIGALLGRITWTQAIVVGVGVAVLFGAPVLIMNLGALGTCP